MPYAFLDTISNRKVTLSAQLENVRGSSDRAVVMYQSSFPDLEGRNREGPGRLFSAESEVEDFSSSYIKMIRTLLQSKGPVSSNPKYSL